MAAATKREAGGRRSSESGPRNHTSRALHARDKTWVVPVYLDLRRRATAGRIPRPRLEKSRQGSQTCGVLPSARFGRTTGASNLRRRSSSRRPAVFRIGRFRVQPSAVFPGDSARGPGQSAPGTKPWSSSQLLGFRDGVRLLMSRDFLRPNERDRAAVHLPESLDSLYYLVRIFRLIRKRFEFQS